MPQLPLNTAIGPDGGVVFAEGGLLDPGWKAAIAMLKLESKLATGEIEALAAERAVDSPEMVNALARLEGCEIAVALLEMQGRRIGLDV